MLVFIFLIFSFKNIFAQFRPQSQQSVNRNASSQLTYMTSTFSSAAKVRSRAAATSAMQSDIPPSSYQNFKWAAELALFAPSKKSNKSKKSKKTNDSTRSTQ